MKFRSGGFFDLLFNIELKKVGVKISREISYFSSPNEKISSDETSQVKDDNDKEVLSKWTEKWKKNDIQNAKQRTPRQQRQQCGECPVVFYFL